MSVQYPRVLQFPCIQGITSMYDGMTNKALLTWSAKAQLKLHLPLSLLPMPNQNILFEGIFYTPIMRNVVLTMPSAKNGKSGKACSTRSLVTRNLLCRMRLNCTFYVFS